VSWATLHEATGTFRLPCKKDGKINGSEPNGTKQSPVQLFVRNFDYLGFLLLLKYFKLATFFQWLLSLSLSLHIYIYIYMCVCVCVCV
jgi:hypothetical protein